MKTILHRATRCAGLALVTGWAGLNFAPAAHAANSSSSEPTYDNYIDVAAGGTDLSGNRASFQKINQENKSGWGGLSGFHYEQDIDRNTTFTANGHVIGGNNDMKFNFRLERDGLGYVDVGYTEYRTWFNGDGGFFPPSGFFGELSNSDLHIDRSDLWVEAALTPTDALKFVFRYDYTTRKGLKDSTEWADTTATAGLGTRNLVPTYLGINEHRHIFDLKAISDTDDTSWKFVGHYETTKLNNTRNENRTPGTASNRYVTQTNDSDNDLFMVRGSVDTKVGDLITMSTGIAHYDIDTSLSGSRIFGTSYDPVFDPAYPGRQPYDEGYYDLKGNTHMGESLANLNLMYTPTKNWSIVPSLLAQKTSWNADSSYIETAVHAGPNLPMGQDEDEASSNKDYRSLTELVEIHYTGFKDVSLNSNLEVMQGYGTLSEDLVAAETGVDTIYRTTNYRQDSQRYDFTANWYVQPGLSLTGQYYWQGRQNGFSNTRDSVSPAPTSGDRYPGYITHQDYETNDFNLRVSYAPMLNVHTTTRYDYQESKIKTQEIGLAFIDSANVKSNVLSETVTWNPLERLYVQGSGSLIYDRTTTPAHDLTGNAAGIVMNSDNNYWNVDVSSGYAVSQTADLSASYSYYRANNYSDNSARSVAYGAAFTNQLLSLTWSQRISASMNYTVRYSYGDYVDPTSGGNNNFRANMIYGRVQYRF